MTEASEGGDGRIVTELKRLLAEHQASGLYPSGMEGELVAHVNRLALGPSRDLTDSIGRFESSVRDVATVDFSLERIAPGSTIPGGAAMHRAVGRLVARYIEGVMIQLIEQRQLLVAALEPVSDVLRNVVEQVGSQRQSDFESLTAELTSRIDDLTLSVDQLRRATPGMPVELGPDGEKFVERFRGKARDIREHYRSVAVQLVSDGPVLDIGFGRGEFLDLLASMGVDAFGVEPDEQLVERARARGLHVECGGGLEWLHACEDDSLGAVTLFQVIEHLPAGDSVELIRTAARKIRHGGKLMIETVNPLSLYAFAHAFYTDPTHTRLVHPEFLEFMVEASGFAQSHIEWRSPPPPKDVLEAVPGRDAVAKAINENVSRINRLLFAPQDYLLVAVR
ncbi:MAG: class I SAM-dependent methyltransferase [Actinomycetota bacterium]|nr:class I SAM-dependent methyltransferase [Actinomycetota bacterium]